MKKRQYRYKKPETVIAATDAYLHMFPRSKFVMMSVSDYMTLRDGLVQHKPLTAIIAKGVKDFGNMQSFANACGVRRETLQRISGGQRRPSPAVLSRIMILTNGA